MARDGSLRPAVEDLWGGGAAITRLAGAAWSALSPEAELAHAGYAAVRRREHHALLRCASGRELIEEGYRADVDIAAELNISTAVPVLAHGCFVPAPPVTASPGGVIDASASGTS